MQKKTLSHRCSTVSLPLWWTTAKNICCESYVAIGTTERNSFTILEGPFIEEARPTPPLLMYSLFLAYCFWISRQNIKTLDKGLQTFTESIWKPLCALQPSFQLLGEYPSPLSLSFYRSRRPVILPVGCLFIGTKSSQLFQLRYYLAVSQKL
jgi:hypothetical protein